MQLTGVFSVPIKFPMDVYKAILPCCVTSHVLFETSPPTGEEMQFNGSWFNHLLILS